MQGSRPRRADRRFPPRFSRRRLGPLPLRPQRSSSRILAAHGRDLAPVEPHARGLFLHFLRAHERGQTAGDAIESGRGFVALLGAFEIIPFAQHFRRVSAAVFTEDVRMPAEQLLRNTARHVVEIEAPFLRGDLRVENRLQEQVAKFLAKVGVVAGVDRRDDLVGTLRSSRGGGWRESVPDPMGSLRAQHAAGQ